MLEELLSRRFRRPCRIVRLVRRPCPYTSSYRLEELDVRLDDGRDIDLVLKDLSRHAMLDSGRRVRPEFLYEPLREIEAYRRLLGRRSLGTAMFYGADVDEQSGRYWLFLERVSGLELRHVGDFATWQAAASWLGRFHRRFEGFTARLGLNGHPQLIRYDAQFLSLWIDRARRHAAIGPPRGKRGRVRGIERLAKGYQRCIEVLAALPPTIIHAELFASNVIVQPTSTKPRICPVDWETMAVGPGLVDLAALASGTWSDERKLELLGAYHAALADHDGPPRRVPRELVVAFDCSQLHLAVRMLGWTGDRRWLPPEQHARDWLEDASRLTRKLSL